MGSHIFGILGETIFLQVGSLDVTNIDDLWYKYERKGRACSTFSLTNVSIRFLMFF